MTIKLFKDRKRKEPLDVIDFGEVEAGTEKIVTIYIYNTTDAHLRNLRYTIDNKYVEVIDPPSEMFPHEIRKLQLRWKSPVTIKKGLKAKLIITGVEVYKA